MILLGLRVLKRSSEVLRQYSRVLYSSCAYATTYFFLNSAHFYSCLPNPVLPPIQPPVIFTIRLSHETPPRPLFFLSARYSPSFPPAPHFPVEIHFVFSRTQSNHSLAALAVEMHCCFYTRTPSCLLVLCPSNIFRHLHRKYNGIRILQMLRRI